MCKIYVPASTEESKFPPTTKWGIIKQRYYKVEKRFPIAVLVTTKLCEPPAEKALVFS